jgi:manganese/iron transport system permease protein/iron/zinc/copper transport system permease protein
MSQLWDPFQFEFFRNGLLVATLAGGLCGLVGTYVVLRGMSYLGHGLSHAVFGGAAASAVVGLNFFLGAGLWGVASALAIGRVARRRSIGGDAAIGVITTASFALGLALFALFGQARRNPEALLFGSILGVGGLDVAVMAAVAAFAGLVIFLGYRPLLFTTFDPEVADASGVRTGRVDALLMLVLAVSILATIKVVGAVLVAAALVIPATVARMVTRSFARTLWLATVIGATCGFAGMIVSYHLDISPGASIVLAAALVFGVVYASTGARGLSAMRA